MNPEYLLVTHTTTKLDPEAIATALGSLLKLTRNNSRGRLSHLGSTEAVTFEFVAINEGRDEPVEYLTPHQQAVFEVVAEEGSITPGDLYEKYRGGVEVPKFDRTVRNYLHKLERYNLVATEGSTRDRVYHCMPTGARN